MTSHKKQNTLLYLIPVVGLILVLLSLTALFSHFLNWKSDTILASGEAKNIFGTFGVSFSEYYLSRFLGIGGIFMLLYLGLFFIKMLSNTRFINLISSFFHTIFLSLWVSLFSAIIFGNQQLFVGEMGMYLSHLLQEKVGGLFYAIVFGGILLYGFICYRLFFRGKNKPSEEKPEIQTIPEPVKPKTKPKPIQPKTSFFSQTESFDFPPTNLLHDYKAKHSFTSEKLYEKQNKIIETLRNYKIEIDDIKAVVGPAVTLFEIIPQAGTKIANIKNRAEDIALGLSALGIRIIAPIPGRGTVGIEIPNKHPRIIALKEVFNSPEFQNHDFEIPLVIGKTVNNQNCIDDLTKMPHLLIAGATGQGKSVCINVLLASILYTKRPEELRFVLIDPKKVELSIFDTIESQYLAKMPGEEEAIITDNSKVISTLNSLCIEMDERYELLKAAHCRNVKEYNKKITAKTLSPDKGHHFMPYIVLVIDEFADLIMTAGREVELPIARLAQLARAVGIHLIIATQRPSVNVITGMIKANFPARIAFRVSSLIDSRTILDSAGAEQLVGRGDMLYSNGKNLLRIQCPLIETDEVEKINAFIAQQSLRTQPFLLPEYVKEDAEDFEMSGESSADLTLEAAKIIIRAGSGSTSLIQRRLSIGFNRAARIIEELEDKGVVGPPRGSKPREVLVSSEAELEKYFS